MNAALHADSHEERAQIVEQLTHALAALERGNDADWRSSVDCLVQWRARPFLAGLAKLAGELEKALGAPQNSHEVGRQSLLEACTRLEHVIEVTERASMRTLDLLDECRALVQLAPGADALPAERITSLRSLMSEISLAQGYQDTTGQIILKVIALVRGVHASLDGMGLADCLDPPNDAALREADSRGHGPAVPDLDQAAATQDDANDILKMMGL